MRVWARARARLWDRVGVGAAGRTQRSSCQRAGSAAPPLSKARLKRVSLADRERLADHLESTSLGSTRPGFEPWVAYAAGCSRRTSLGRLATYVERKAEVTGQHGPGCRLPEACQSLEQPRERSTPMEASGEPAGRGGAEVGAGSFSTWLLTGRRGRSDARRAPSRPRRRRSRRVAAHRPAGSAAKPCRRTWSATPERFGFRGNKTTRGDFEGVFLLL